MENIERCARILGGIRDSAGFEHVLAVLVRDGEAAALHVTQDGSAWYGLAGDEEEVAEMAELVEGVGATGERDITELARGFSPEAGNATVEALLGGVLWILAEPIGCTAAAILARDVGEDPAWLAARYRPGSVSFMETAPDAFTRELVQVHDIAGEQVGGGARRKPSLQAAEAGSSYEVDIAPEGMQILEEMREAFEEKFGRPPGPDDPIFFDPEADTPQPFPAEKMADLEARMAEHGFDQEWFLRNQAAREEEGALRRPERARIGRNDPCWCGSGKKYKRCHGS